MPARVSPPNTYGTPRYCFAAATTCPRSQPLPVATVPRPASTEVAGAAVAATPAAGRRGTRGGAGRGTARGAVRRREGVREGRGRRGRSGGRSTGRTRGAAPQRLDLAADLADPREHGVDAHRCPPRCGDERRSRRVRSVRRAGPRRRHGWCAAPRASRARVPTGVRRCRCPAPGRRRHAGTGRRRRAPRASRASRPGPRRPR